MRDRSLNFLGCLAAATTIAAWLAEGPLAAQQAARPVVKPAAKTGTMPRTPDGKPDLSGFYDVATMTPVERPAGVTRLVLTPEEAAALEKYEDERQVKNDAPLSGDRAAPPVGGENTTPEVVPRSSSRSSAAAWSAATTTSGSTGGIEMHHRRRPEAQLDRRSIRRTARCRR